MNSFRKEYMQAMGQLPKFHMEEKQIRDGLYHSRPEKSYRNKMIARGCTAAVLFVLCGAGTVAAGNISRGTIEVSENGYVVSNTDPDYGMAVCDNTPVRARTVAPDNVEYDSLEEFLETSELADKIPNLSPLKEEFEGESLSVSVSGAMTHVIVLQEGKIFSLTQMDFRDTEGYSMGTGYTGTAANERSCTGNQGFCYVVFDTVDEEGQIEATHAALSLEGRELSMDFRGFEAEKVEKLLKELDLTLYFTE